MFHVNPVLNIVGWHIYEITKEGGDLCTIITKHNLKKGCTIFVVQISEDLYFGFSEAPE
jgi:hypothetical protein